ncbi:MAG: hypothetical protein ACR2LL_07965 [Nitrosopumilus sp.]
MEQYCLELIVWEMVAKSYHNHGAKGPDNDAGIGVIDPGYASGAVSLAKKVFAEQRV